ncbi:MAG: TonB-dependent receptor, partial [Bacteroidales bacterium]
TLAPGQIRLSMTEMQKIPALMGEQDPLGSLRSLPGIQSVGEGSGYFYVRGGNADQNLILLDDAILYNPSHLLGIFSVINPGIIRSVTVYKGGIPATYGDRLASVIDLNTRDGNMQNTSGEASIGLIATRFMLEGPLVKDKASWLFAIRRTHLDLLSPIVLPKRSAFHGSNYYFLDINGKISWNISEWSRITLSAYTGTDQFRLEDSEVELSDHMRWGNQSMSLISSNTLSGRVSSKTVFSWSGYHLDFDQVYRNISMGLTSGLSNVRMKQELQIHLGENQLIRTGFEIQGYLFKPYRMKIRGESVNQILGDSLPYHAREAALFLHHEWKPATSWTIQTGIRVMGFEHFGPFDRYINDQNGIPADTIHYPKGKVLATFIRPEPRLALSWQTAPGKMLKASVTHQYQPVTMVPIATATLPFDLWVPSTSLIPPQAATSVTLGWFIDSNGHGIEAYIDGFYRWMNNQAEFRESQTMLGIFKDNMDRQIAMGKGTARGIEFFIRKKTGKTQGWIGYTWSQVWLVFPDINDGKRFHPRHDRTHDINILITRSFRSRWEGSLQFIYATGQPTTMPLSVYVFNGTLIQQYSERNAVRLPAYHRIDLSLTRNPAIEKKIKSTWTFSIYNLYNRLNPLLLYYDLQWDYDKSLLTTRSRQLALLPLLPSVTWTCRF